MSSIKDVLENDKERDFDRNDERSGETLNERPPLLPL